MPLTPGFISGNPGRNLFASPLQAFGLRRLLLGGLTLVAWTLDFQYATGQSSPHYDLVRGVIAGGGAIFTFSNRYQLGSSMGQPVTQGANSVRFTLNGGFWNVPPSYLFLTKSATGANLTSGISWMGGAVPGPADIANWSANSLGTGLTLNSPLSWGGMNLAAAAANVSISGNGPLTLGSAGIDLSASSQDLTMNLPVILGTYQTWNLGANGMLVMQGVIAGNGGLSLAGAGTLVLTNANTYIGGTTVNGGVLALDYNPGDTPTGTLASASTATVSQGGTLRLDGEDVLGYSGGALAALNIAGGLVTSADVANTTPVQSGGTSFRVTLPTLNFTGGTLSSGVNMVGDILGGSYLVGAINTLASSNTAVINANSVSLQNTTFTVASGTTASGVDLYVSSVLNNWNSAPQSLTKTGPGIMVLDNANTFTGGTTVDGGVLGLDYNPGDTPTGTLAAATSLTVNRGGTLRLDTEDVLGFYGGSLAALNINGGLVTSADVIYPTPVQEGGTSFRVTLPPVTFIGGTLSSGTNMVGDVYGGCYLASVINTLASSNTAVINAFSVSLQNTTFTVASGSTAYGVDLEVSSILNNWVNSPQSLIKAGPGIMALEGANTYSGPTMINAGTLALAGSGSIASTPGIAIAGGATLDVSALNAPLVLGSRQTLGNAGSPGFFKGNASTSSGTVSLQYTNGTPSLEMTGGTLTLSTNTIFAITNTGGPLPVGIYPLIGNTAGGMVAGAVSSGAVTVTGGGTAAQAVLEIAGGELILVVGNPVNTTPTNLTATVVGGSLILSWPADHIGWTLQSNAVSLVNTGDWYNVPGSAGTNHFLFPINPLQSNVFYRLVYP